MKIDDGTVVHVHDFPCPGWGRIGGTWYYADGATPKAYNVIFEGGVLGWIDACLVDDVSALQDRPRICFSTFAGRA